jgi:hypothetical protein
MVIIMVLGSDKAIRPLADNAAKPKISQVKTKVMVKKSGNVLSASLLRLPSLLSKGRGMSFMNGSPVRRESGLLLIHGR